MYLSNVNIYKTYTFVLFTFSTTGHEGSTYHFQSNKNIQIKLLLISRIYQCMILKITIYLLLLRIIESRGCACNCRLHTWTVYCTFCRPTHLKMQYLSPFSMFQKTDRTVTSICCKLAQRSSD